MELSTKFSSKLPVNKTEKEKKKLACICLIVWLESIQIH